MRKEIILLFALFLISLPSAFAIDEKNMSGETCIDSGNRVDSNTVGTATESGCVASTTAWVEKEQAAGEYSIVSNTIQWDATSDATGDNVSINLFVINGSIFRLYDFDMTGFGGSGRVGIGRFYDSEGVLCYAMKIDFDGSFWRFKDDVGFFGIAESLPTVINVSFRLNFNGSLDGNVNITRMDAINNFTRNLDNNCLNISKAEVLTSVGAIGGTVTLQNMTVINGTISSSSPDTTPPTITSTSINNTAPKINDVVQFGINCTDETAIGSVYFANNRSGTFINSSSILGLNQQSVNFTANLTNNRTRGEVIGGIFTCNDTSSNTLQSSILTYTVADTIPTFSIERNNSAPKINEVAQIQGIVNESDTVSMVIFSWNGSSSGLWINLSNSTASSLGLNYTVNATIGRSRNNTVGYLFYSNDSVSSVFTVSSLTTFVVANTQPTIPSFVNGSDRNTNKNQTINWSSSDADTDDRIRFDVYFSKCPLSSLEKFTTSDLNFTTNMTSDGDYCLNISVTDGEFIINSTMWNITLDTSTPTLTSCNVANSTAYNKNTTISCTCDDSNLFELNATSSSVGTSTILFSNSSINLTPTYTSYTTGININTTWGEGNYNISFWCGDTKNKKLPIEHIKAGSNSNYQQFNDTMTGTQINLTFGILLPNDAFLTLSDKEPYFLKDSLLKNIMDNGKIEHYKTFYNVSLPPLSWLKIINPSLDFTNLRFALQVKANRPSMEIDDNLAGHLLIGSGKQRISFDADDLRELGYTIKFITLNNIKYLVINPRSDLYAEGTLLDFDPRIDNLNTIQNDAEIIIDESEPIFNSLNLSYNGFKGNNTFISATIINITLNVSDVAPTNPNNASVLFYVDNVKNISTTYQNNVSKNASISITIDGNYTALIEINDSAGNKANGTYLLGFVIDTKAPTFASAYNRTADAGNSTDILTTTDVNITIFGLDDLYLSNGNFSHNASGTWTNQSISIIGNTTPYYYVIGSGNFTANQVVGWKFYVYDIAGNELDPIYTFSIGSPPTTPTTTTATGGGGAGGGAIGATRQCREYAIIYQSCYYFDGISQCLKGCPKEQKCASTFECEVINTTTSTTSLQSPLNAVTTPLQSFFSWVKQLLGLSKNNPNLPQSQLSILENKPIVEEQTQSASAGFRENTAKAFEQNKWLPYIIVGFVIAGFGIYIFGLWQAPLALLMGLGAWGYIIMFIIGIMIYMWLKYF